MQLASTKPAVFLDRDGTLIVEMDYLRDPDRVLLEKGVAEGLKLLQNNGHPLIVVSNQSGIGRGLFSEADALRVNERVDSLLRQEGVVLTAWYMCPHSPDASCSCRKPLPGMAEVASHQLQVSLVGSYVIGDKKADLELADAIGGTGILVTSGHGRGDQAWARADARPVFESFVEAAVFICSSGSNATRGQDGGLNTQMRANK